LPRYYFIFFFQAEDGIRYRNVTGVQTCALPIFSTIGQFKSHTSCRTSKVRACNTLQQRHHHPILVSPSHWWSSCSKHCCWGSSFSRFPQPMLQSYTRMHHIPLARGCRPSKGLMSLLCRKHSFHLVC